MCVQYNTTRAARDIGGFFPGTIFCSVHMFPVGLEETKHCLPQAILCWMQFDVKKKKKKTWEIAVKGNNARGGGWRRRGLPRGLQFPESRAWVSRVIFFFLIYILQSTVIPWRPQQMKPLYCVCFINQAARSHYFLTEELPAKTAGMFKKKIHQKTPQFTYF